MFCHALPVQTVNKDEQESWQTPASFPIILPLLPVYSHNNAHVQTHTHAHVSWLQKMRIASKIKEKKRKDWEHLQLSTWKSVENIILPFYLFLQPMTPHLFETWKIYWRSRVVDNLFIYTKWICIGLFFLRCRSAKIFNFFKHISFKNEAWQQGLFLPTASIASAELHTESSQPGWKCVKAVKGVWCALFCSGSGLTVGWTMLRCAGCFDMR